MVIWCICENLEIIVVAIDVPIAAPTFFTRFCNPAALVWSLLDKENGKKMLNGVIAKLRSEIEIPVES